MSRGCLLPTLGASLLAVMGPGLGTVAAAPDDSPLPLTLPAGTRFGGGLLAGLVRSSQPLSFESFTVRAYNVTLHEGWTDTYAASVDTGDVPSGIEPTPKKGNDSFHVELEMTFLGSRRGHVGLHGDGDAAVTFAGRGPCTLEPRDRTVLSIGNPIHYEKGEETRNTPNALQYYSRVEEPHVLATCAGDLVIDGPLILQFFGLDVQARSSSGENVTIRTGEWEKSYLAAVEEHARWVYLTADRVVIESRSPMRWRMALTDAETEGAYVTPDRLVLDGSTRTAATAPAGDAGIEPPRLLGWVLAGGAVVGGGLLLQRARGRGLPSALDDPGEGWDAEECMARADFHIQTERFDRALAWATQARKLAPTSYTVRATEGFLLGRLGRVDEGLEAYREASRLAPEDGGPDLEAARLALDGGKPHSVVEEFLENALTKNPLLVPEVDEQEEFSVLAGSPRFERAVSKAWDAYADRSSGRDEA